MQACTASTVCLRSVHRSIKSVSRCTRASSTALAKPTDFYDVVCVGGGPAGLSLVSALRSSKVTSGLKIALVESQDLAKTPSPILSSPSEYSNRCSSLTLASVKYLNDIGAWHHIDTTRIQPYTSMHVWDGITGAQLTFDWSSGLPSTSPPAPSSPQTTIAYMTENTNITSALLSRVRELGSVSIFDNTKVEGIELGEETEELDLRSWPHVQLSNGRTLAARLLVGADGANSPVRTFAGIESRGWEYDRHGVVATLQMEGHDSSSSSSDIGAASHQATAYQRFLPTGPIALLPLPNNLASLVWSTLPSHAAHLKTLAPEDFTAMVNAGFRLSPVDLRYMHTQPSGQLDELNWRVQHTPFSASLVPRMVTSVQASSIASFPLKLRHADTYHGERIALLGDAAHTIHPLAGQGLNLGQADVSALASVISDAVASGQDIGSTLALEEYTRKRYAGNNLMLGVVDKLHKLYSWEAGPVVWGRSVGVGVLEGMGWVKRGMMRVAAGV